MTPQIQNIREVCSAVIASREAATPGEWDNRCIGLDNSSRPRYIWDSTWGFIGEMNSGSQDIVNAKFVVTAANHSSQLAKSLLIAVEALEKYEDDKAKSDGWYDTNIACEALEQITSQLMGEL